MKTSTRDGITVPWDDLSITTRNRLCAWFMPASDENPIWMWFLTIDGTRWQPLRLKEHNESEALKWIRFAKSNRKNWKHCLDLPWEVRARIGVRELRYHVNYSDSMNGAWMLYERILSASYQMEINQASWSCRITARASGNADVIQVVGQLSLSESIAVLWLLFNGMEVQSSKLVEASFVRF